MKRILVIATALTLISFSTYAQLFTLGPKIGISSSKINVADDIDGIVSGDAAVGFHAGLFARVSVLGFYVQPEALFTSTTGNIVLEESVTQNARSVQELTYNKIDVPVMVGVKIGPVLRVFAGPTFSYILSQDIREEGTSVIADIEQNFNEANVGFQAGLGLDISKLVIDLKYENNLSVLGESVTFRNQTFPTDMRNRLFQLSVGWKLL